MGLIWAGMGRRVEVEWCGKIGERARGELVFEVNLRGNTLADLRARLEQD